MIDLVTDLRQALRSLASKPAFTAVAVLTLGLGIGANTAIFSVVDGVLLARLPYAEPERLVAVWETTPTSEESSFAPGDLVDLRRDSRTLAAASAFANRSPSLTGTGEPERLPGVSVSGDFFTTLGVEPLLGTGLDDQPLGERLAMLSWGLWQRRFAADPGVVGRTITLDGETHRVTGVLPQAFRFALSADAEVWFREPRGLPEPGFNLDTDLETLRDLHYFKVVARLAPGVGLDEAAAEIDALGARYARDYPDSNAGRGMRLEPLREKLVGDVRPALMVLLAAVGLVLLIACANVAGLLLTRSLARGREVAVRSALGASRWRLVRQVLAEGAVLAAAGGGVGLALGAWSLETLLGLAPPGITGLGPIGLDRRVLGFTLALTALSVLLSSLVPALRASRPELAAALGEGGARTGGGSAQTRLRALLVVGETALALMLLAGAGLLVRSLGELLAVDPGFDPEHVLTASLSLPERSYPDEAQAVAFVDRLLERVAALPGVVEAGRVWTLPFGGSAAIFSFRIEGQPPPEPGSEPDAGFQAADTGYFRALRIPLLAGRWIEPADRDDAPDVALVNRAFAETFFDGRPLGRRISLGDPADGEPWIEIVGVVGDVRHHAFDQPVRPEVYLPYPQFTLRTAVLVLRTAGPPEAMAGALRTELGELDPELPLSRVEPLATVVADSTAERRFVATLMSLFAGLAAFLAGLGLYGVIAHSVAQRTREIGIRLALGARRRQVLGQVVGRGLALAAAGVAVGLAGAWGATRTLASLLYGVGAVDPATYSAVSLGLVAVAALAALVPARRAARIEPRAALRAE
jgi:putative ABC transport system permease protein